MHNYVDYGAAAVVIALLGVLVAFGVGTISNRNQRKQTDLDRHDEARTEAMNLAEIRASTILTLREDLDKLQKEQLDERQACERSITELRDTIGRVGTEAADAQRLLLGGMRNVLAQALVHLEQEPPDVDQAISFLREMLAKPTEGGKP